MFELIFGSVFFILKWIWDFKVFIRTGIYIGLDILWAFGLSFSRMEIGGWLSTLAIGGIRVSEDIVGFKIEFKEL